MKTEERNKIGCQTPKSTIKREIMSTFVQSSNSELCKTKIIVAIAELICMGREPTLQPRTPAKSSPAQTYPLGPRLFLIQKHLKAKKQKTKIA